MEQFVFINLCCHSWLENSPRSTQKIGVDMVDKITAVLAGALMLFSAGAAPAQSGAGETLAYDQARPRAEQYCYLPSEPCDNNHRVSN